MRHIHRFIRLLKVPFKYRYSFKIPRQTRIVIYPAAKAADILLDYVGGREAQFISPYSNILNVPVLLRMLLGRKRSRLFYVLSYLKFIKPSMVITTTDIDLNFFLIKSYLPHITTIAIQNGINENISTHPNKGFYDQLKMHSLDHELKADFVCTFGTAIQNEYKKYISANFVATGSLRNNFFGSTNIEERPNRLVYISGMSDLPFKPDQIFRYFRGMAITFKEFHGAEATICALLAEYCARHDLEFVICGKRSSSNIVEAAFYKNELKHLLPLVSPRNNTFDSYELLSSARYVITLNGSLAYEFLSRGKRTAFFNTRFDELNSRLSRPEIESLHELAVMRFGYPLPLPQSGPFWSSVLSMSEIERVIGYLREATDRQWTQVIEPFGASLMVYDPGNAIIKTLIDTKIQNSSL